MTSFTNFTKTPIPQARLSTIYEKILKYLRERKSWGVSVVFCGSDRMRTLNRRYRKKNQSTNVLSFTYRGKGEDGGILGEIFLCPEMIKRDMRRWGLGYRELLERLFLHAVLHLFDYEHDEVYSRDKMESLEDKIYSKIKNGNPKKNS